MTAAFEVLQTFVQLHEGGAATAAPATPEWHRLVLKEPGDLLFVTPPRDTRLRPVA